MLLVRDSDSKKKNAHLQPEDVILIIIKSGKIFPWDKHWKMVSVPQLNL